VRRSAAILTLLGAVAYLWRSARSGRDDREVWTAATAAPDLR
jgi:hypothetical protein